MALAIALAAVAIGVWGILVNAQMETQIEVRLIWKRAFADKLIPDGKPFPPLEIKEEIESGTATEEGKEFLLNSLRRQVAWYDRIIFFEGTAVKDLRSDKKWPVRFSDNDEYIGIEEREIIQELTASRVWFTLFTKSGQLLWRKTIAEKEYPEISTGALVQNSGDVAVVSGMMANTHGTTIYGKSGAVVLQIPPGEEGVRLASPGEKAILAYWCIRDVQSSSLWFVSSGGRVLWQKELKDIGAHLGNGFQHFSDNGKYIFVAAASNEFCEGSRCRQLLLDDQGRLIREFCLFYPSYWNFSPDGQYLTVIDNGRKLVLLKSSTGEILWEKRVTKKQGHIRKAAVTRDGNLILVRGTIPFNGVIFDGDVTLSDRDGHFLWGKKLGSADVSIAPDGSYFYVKTTDALCYYAVRQPGN